MTSKRERRARSKRVLVLQHAASENLGTIEKALRAEKLEFDYVRSFEGQPIPKALDSYSALIVMGGPMGVYETARYPFLTSEMNLIDRFLKARRPILGVCLGSQLLATCLGAKVKKGDTKEIGWCPVRLTAEAQRDTVWRGQPGHFTAFHWHGDVFDLPAGSVSLASSRITPVQAFRYDTHAYGLLFHLEITIGHLRKMLDEFVAEIQQEELSARAIIRDAKSFLPSLQTIGSSVFTHWAGYI